MEKGLVDLSEGVAIGVATGTAFATTGCTGKPLFGEFDLADLGSDPAEAASDLYNFKKRKKQNERKSKWTNI